MPPQPTIANLTLSPIGMPPNLLARCVSPRADQLFACDKFAMGARVTAD